VLQCVAVCCRAMHTAPHCSTLQHTTVHLWCSTDASRRHRNVFPHTRHKLPHTRPTCPPKQQGYDPQDSAEFRSVRSTLLLRVRETYALSHSSQNTNTFALIAPYMSTYTQYISAKKRCTIHIFRPCFEVFYYTVLCLVSHSSRNTNTFELITPYISTYTRYIFHKRSVSFTV